MKKRVNALEQRLLSVVTKFCRKHGGDPGIHVPQVRAFAAAFILVRLQSRRHKDASRVQPFGPRPKG